MTRPAVDAGVFVSEPLLYAGNGLMVARADPEWIHVQFPSTPAAQVAASDMVGRRWQGRSARQSGIKQTRRTGILPVIAQSPTGSRRHN